MPDDPLDQFSAAPGDRAEVTEQLAQITEPRVKGLMGDATMTGERASQRAPATEERNESGTEPLP